jgi:cation diffusion facilitator CzcD-associated flavoprotein CzcO
MNSTEKVDVVVVGAGAAGVRTGVALSMLDLDVRIIERDEIGASFRQWPDEMRFITPSFPSNSFGLTDLNAVTPNSSPAFTLDREHPSGEEYADYLEATAEFFELPVETGVEVQEIQPLAATDTSQPPTAVDGGESISPAADSGFLLETTTGPIHSEHVVWAAGQFGAPRTDLFAGSEHCIHNSEIESWNDHATASGDDEFLIIGGYESGVDAAVGLHEAGCSVHVLDRSQPWVERDPDPSEVLSPYTLERFHAIADSDRLTLSGNRTVEAVRQTDGGQFAVETRSLLDDTTEEYTVGTPPILATGFETNLGPAESLFPVDDRTVQLTDRDESASTSGLFLAGPDVTHNGVKFCFIYKFRARFPVIAETIGERLGVDTDPLDVYREQNMFLEDLSCCEPDMCDC